MHIPFVSEAFGWLFKALYELSQHQYLLTLFLFAVVVKVALLPFGIKQQKNSLKQASIRPKEMAIRRKYAGRNDKATQQKMSEEIMKLYQDENINPMGGCLPLLIQMPILFALYDVIRNPLTYILGYSNDVVNKLCGVVGMNTKSIDQIKLVNQLVENKAFDVKGASFETVENLKESFKFFNFDLTVIPQEKWGAYIAIPVLTFVFSFFSTKLIRKFTYQPQATDASTQASMGMMDWMMPLMSVWISVILSSALGIYWMFQNVLSVLQQILLYKLYPIPAITEEQIKEAELQLKGKSSKKKPAVFADYEVDDYDKTDINAEEPQKEKNTETSISVRKAGISPKVKQIVSEGRTLKARKKI